MRRLAWLASCWLVGGAGAGVSVVVRNLVGEDVQVSWLQPGAEPRARVPQQEKALKNATTMSINSYETHEFIVASVGPKGGGGGGPKKGGGADRNENCAFWASVGECEANPGYMRSHCGASCAKQDVVAAARTGETSVVFAVSDSPETVSVVKRADGGWAIERRGPSHDAASAVERAFESCEAGGAEACRNPDEVPACVARLVETFLSPRRAELDVERRIFEASYAMVPDPKPDPAHEKAEKEDLGLVHSSYRKGSANVDVLGACPRGSRDCLHAVLYPRPAKEKKARDARLERRRASSGGDLPERRSLVDWEGAGGRTSADAPRSSLF